MAVEKKQKEVFKKGKKTITFPTGVVEDFTLERLNSVRETYVKAKENFEDLIALIDSDIKEIGKVK